MKFGKVDHPEQISHTLPEDHPGTESVLQRSNKNDVLKIYVGLPNWNRAKLKGFYPRGTKDELSYYATQFNAIELNATFYRIFPAEQFSDWYDKTPEDFKFFPKLYQEISHWKRLKGTGAIIEHFINNAANLKEKLGTVFLQMPGNFTPRDFNRVVNFVEEWPIDIPLAIEFRHSDWFNNKGIAEALYQLFERNNVSNVIVDTAGRRDLLHMRLTNTTTFVRFVAANHEIDYKRLDEWVLRLNQWKSKGIKEIDFLIHQNIKKDVPLLSAYLIKKMNHYLGCKLEVPGNDQ